MFVRKAVRPRALFGKKPREEYIGAPLRQVQDAVRQGKMRFGMDRDALVVVMGAGTKQLSMTLAKGLIARWWKSEPGTRIVVGWVHSDGIEYNGSKTPPPKYKIKLVAVPRPRPTEQFDEDTPAGIFEEILYRKAQAVDRRMRYINPGYENPRAWGPTFTGDDGMRWGLSPFFVWPAGVVESHRLSDLTNKLQKIQMDRHHERQRRGDRVYSNAARRKYLIDAMHAFRQARK